VAGLRDLVEELLDGIVVDGEVLEDVAGAGGRHPLRTGTDSHPDDFGTDFFAGPLVGRRRTRDNLRGALGGQSTGGGVFAHDEFGGHPNFGRGRVLVFREETLGGVTAHVLDAVGGFGDCRFEYLVDDLHVSAHVDALAPTR
jgi:hypothetical protein